MKLKSFLIIAAIVSCLCGMAALLAPALVMSLFSVGSEPVISMLALFSGLNSVTLGIMHWFTRNMDLSQAKTTNIPALLIFNVTGIIITDLGSLTGSNRQGCISTGLYAFF